MKPWIALGAVVSSSLIGIWVWLDQARKQQEADALDQLLASHRDALARKRSGHVLDETRQATAQARREMLAALDRRRAQIATGSTAVLTVVKKSA